MAASSHLSISYIELQNAKAVESFELLLGNNHPHKITTQQKSVFRESFQPPLIVDVQEFSLSIAPRRSRLSFSRKGVETVSISRQDMLDRTTEHKYRKKHGKLTIIIGCQTQTIVAPGIPSDPLPPSPSTTAPESLRPTTEELLRQCPRFRILVIGKSGVGKSSLINRTFGIEKALVASDRPGKANINEELISRENDRFILHDSQGFEAGEDDNYSVMKAFIESRKREPFIKDQLHAVWLCVQVPLPGFGERLIETNAEQFWREKKEVLGDIPTIVVFTKYDRLITKMRVDNAASTESDARQYLQNKCIAPIQKLSGEKNISHVAVSLNKGYEQGQKDLVQLTFDKVSEHFVPQLNTPSPVPVVTSMAQRMLPRPKIDGSIQVGKQSASLYLDQADSGIHPVLKEYWRALASSPNFPGYTIQDCLRVIHTDIISVWNFHDPSGYLASEMLRMYMLDMIKDIGDIGPPETSPEPDHDFITEQCGPSFIFLPITMPLVAGAALISWVHETYQRVPNVQQKFMAYIVDLTHVLEILFELTADNSEKKLTRRSIKVAYKAYLQSSLKRAVHSDVRDFHGIGAIIGGRDLILEKIESLLQTSYTSDVPLAQLVSTVPRASLDMDEEWGTI